MTWKEQLLSVRKEWYLENYQAARDIGVPAPAKPYNDTTSNGLTRCIYDFLKFKGHYVNRINTQGQVRIERIEMANGGFRNHATWTKGTTNLGTADIMAIVHGKSLMVEIKAGKDKIREDQLKEMARVQKAGGIYYIAKNMDSFLAWYNTL